MCFNYVVCVIRPLLADNIGRLVYQSDCNEDQIRLLELFVVFGPVHCFLKGMLLFLTKKESYSEDSSPKNQF